MSQEKIAAALEDFREAILEQRGALAENGMSAEQINDVLAEFDGRFDITALRAQPTPPVQEGETPRTDAIMAFVGQLHSASGETYYALKEGAECGIANLERELEAARKEADRLTALVIERDKDRARLTAECDEITALNHAQWLSLENVRMLAGRFRKEEWAQHALRFCEEAGNASRILRAAKPAAVPEGWRLVPVADIVNVERGFEYSEGMHAPWVTVTFPNNAWNTRDNFACALETEAAPEAPAVVGEIGVTQADIDQSEAIEAVMKERGYPSSPKAAARAACGVGEGWEKRLCASHPSPTPQAARAAAEAAMAEIDPIDDREQGDLYTYCRGTPHYLVVRRLYRLAYAQVNGLPTPPKE